MRLETRVDVNAHLSRPDNLLRSSLYAHFSESLSGLATIRAYGEDEKVSRLAITPGAESEVKPVL